MILFISVLLSFLSPSAARLLITKGRDSCVGRTDGFYVKGCNDIYMLCVEGVKYELKCPKIYRYRDDRFNPKTAKCEAALLVEQCAGGMDQNKYYKALYNHVSWKATLLKPREMCSPVYGDCISIYCFDIECPRGHYHDESRGGCKDPKNIFGCQQILNVNAQSEELLSKRVQESAYNMHVLYGN